MWCTATTQSHLHLQAVVVVVMVVRVVRVVLVVVMVVLVVLVVLQGNRRDNEYPAMAS